MSIADDIVEALGATEDEPEAQAAAAAEILVSSRADPEREALRAALDAATVVRWFDVGLLSRLLQVREEEAQYRFDTLKRLPFVERYRAGGRDLHNVQTSTRRGWRKRLLARDPERFRALCARARAALPMSTLLPGALSGSITC